ncbi:Hypothetical protein LEPBI_p0030 (plasmid) [Leptospira biflexa serovar Patoc strain 'Patoc 1 (Paris)']|uniref:CHAT domain-containing protein n=2 Tax=Leptospira biflexa TaxID=172 RepID=B0SUG0_LEPBP|nr:Hypothetical protein LEPBI_p0030 [Leptospira biflexa serovar Patoc strain 'Patoc 1 (Paris)']
MHPQTPCQSLTSRWDSGSGNVVSTNSLSAMLPYQNLKMKLNDKIIYFIILERNSYLISPIDVRKTGLIEIPKLPKNINQFLNAELFTKVTNDDMINPIIINFLYDDYQIDPEIINNFEHSLKVFIIGSQNEIKLDFSKIVEPYIVGSLSNNFPAYLKDRIDNKLIFNNYEEFTSLLKAIIEILKSKNFDFKFLPPNKEIDIEFSVHEFSVSILNFLIENQIYGNFWDGNPTKTLELKYTDRQENILNHLTRNIILQLESQTSERKNIPPLIFCLPYNDFKGLKSNHTSYKEIFTKVRKLNSSSQRSDYLFESDFAGDINDKQTQRIISLSANLTKLKLDFLDFASYLHASFRNSPIYRAPIIGNEINKILSYLDPKNQTPNFQKIFYKLLTIFNKKISKIIDLSKLQKIVETFEIQFIAISDLPVEWLTVNEVPIAFQSDITRIPEKTHPSILANYVHNLHQRVTISEDIIKDTLIVFGSLDDELRIGYEHFIKNPISSEIKISICNSKADLFFAINKYKPKIIIFDSHGSPNTEEYTSNIKLGADLLTGNDVVAFGKFAPIIILSCCSTFPTMNYYNALPMAFLETGTISITSTFLPIGIGSAYMLYYRILNNLIEASNSPVHKNWLSFISHNIRTSAITLSIEHIILKFAKKGRTIKYDIYRHLDLLVRLMKTDQRSSIYKNWAFEIANLFDKKYHKEIISLMNEKNMKYENLYYTNIGRSDLIYFDSWLKR